MRQDKDAGAGVKISANTPARTRVRWAVVAALFSMSFLTIVDRVCISAAQADMARDLGLSSVTFGFVFGMFALGYALLQVPSGWLVDRYGPRVFLAAIVALWSIFTGAKGLIYGAGALIALQFLFGLAESGAYPAAGRAIFNWLPGKERGIGQGILFVGSRLGAAFGLAVMSLSVQAFGWRASFVLLGAIGLVWAALWWLWFRDLPREKRNLSASELFHIEQDRGGGAAGGGRVEWRTLLLSRGVPGLLLQYFASNFTFFLCFSWLLPYLKMQYNLTAAEAGMYASVPLYFGAAGHWMSGFVVDALYRRGRHRISRLAPAVFGFALATAALVATASTGTVQGAVACFALATLGVDFTLTPSWTACMDIAGKHTGTLSGAMNMIGNIGSFVSSVTFPVLLSATGSTRPYFYLAALLNAAAIACWWGVRPEGVAKLENNL
jgi:ACS family glucarate transporter-like MFS transporter